jgi:hypothetical protein
MWGSSNTSSVSVLQDVYVSGEPAEAFHARVAFCLDLHNEAVKALRYEVRKPGVVGGAAGRQSTLLHSMCMRVRGDQDELPDGYTDSTRSATAGGSDTQRPPDTDTYIQSLHHPGMPC